METILSQFHRHLPLSPVLLNHLLAILPSFSFSSDRSERGFRI